MKRRAAARTVGFRVEADSNCGHGVGWTHWQAATRTGVKPPPEADFSEPRTQNSSFEAASDPALLVDWPAGGPGLLALLRLRFPAGHGA